jgi:hypothetical protein
MRRRLFIAKAERLDTTQRELEFAHKLAHSTRSTSSSDSPLRPHRRILPRALAIPSLLAHILSDKFCDGLPFHRQECMA